MGEGPSIPTEDGLYWAKDRFSGEWSVIQVNTVPGDPWYHWVEIIGQETQYKLDDFSDFSPRLRAPNENEIDY